ncbi:hypothetical protein [Mesorhizobium sp. ESP-6-2]|nr:hypothetical protein [Mesorhizobium sp. ESP-6-2]MBZ9807683.1 hypothetical protein [Mesorhizobium sp. ESP-6-2]
MNPLDRRRNRPDPADQRKAQEEVRRQIALAVSIAEKRALAALQQDTVTE